MPFESPTCKTLGMSILDVGCGLGGPTRNLAKFTDTTVTGIDVDDHCLNRARKITQRQGLQDTVHFIKVSCAFSAYS